MKKKIQKSKLSRYDLNHNAKNFVLNILNSQDPIHYIEWVINSVPLRYYQEIFDTVIQAVQKASEDRWSDSKDRILTSIMNAIQQLDYIGEKNKAWKIMQIAMKYDLEYNHQPVIRWAIQQNILQIAHIEKVVLWLEINGCTVASQLPSIWLEKNLRLLQKLEVQKMSESIMYYQYI
jgi:hypothetical protein